MNSRNNSTLRSLWVAARAVVLFTVVLGIGYTAVITLAAQTIAPARANGSLVGDPDAPVGSALIGQAQTDAAGNPLPEFFHGRPSAAGDGYDGAASSGSNLGPEHPDLVGAIGARQEALSQSDGVPIESIPADAVTASASGLDPHIRPEYAEQQVARVAAARGLPVPAVEALVTRCIEPRDLGFLGAPRVNVLQLNLALEDLALKSSEKGQPEQENLG